MKDQELFYVFTDADDANETASFNSSVTASQSSLLLNKLLPFLEDHLHEKAELVRALTRAAQSNDAVHYSCEDYAFCMPR
jgi:hypothetical protein